jgi:hypothetical protein
MAIRTVDLAEFGDGHILAGHANNQIPNLDGDSYGTGKALPALVFPSGTLLAAARVYAFRSSLGDKAERLA